MSKIDLSKCCYYNEDNSPFCCELYDNECEAQNCYFQQLQLAIQKLEKIEQILELYANSKIGTLQDNGTYRIDCGGNAVTGLFGLQLSNPFGLPSTFTYDPRPAKEGLQIIEE